MLYVIKTPKILKRFFYKGENCYYFYELEEHLLNSFVKSSMSFYKPLINLLNQYNVLSNLFSYYLKNDNFNKSLELEEEQIKTYNIKYDNLLIKIIVFVLLGFLILLFIPILLGLSLIILFKKKE